MLKRCIKCEEVKPFTDFQLSAGEPHSYCRLCNNTIRRENYLKNQEKAIAYAIEYNKQNPEKHKKSLQKWNAKNPDKVKEYSKSPASVKGRKKYETGKGKLAKYLRSRLRKALLGFTKNGSAVRDLGCSIEEFKRYIESKFQPGMTWENRGLYGWHLDHIKPLFSFNLENREELLQACHYTNFQPLWSEDHKIKTKKDRTC